MHLWIYYLRLNFGYERNKGSKLFISCIKHQAERQAISVRLFRTKLFEFLWKLDQFVSYQYYPDTMTEQLPELVLDEVTELTYNSFKKRREEERLDPNKFQQFNQNEFRPLYPYTHDETGNKRQYFCCEACCGEDIGRFCCCTSKPPDKSFINFGLAICIYLKFLKHSASFYVLISLLAITSCVVCFAVSIQNDFTPLNDYPTFFYSTTLGTFAAEHNKCSYALISSTNTASLSAKCSYGFINASITAYPITLTSQSLNSLYNCRNERKKLESSQNLASSYLASSGSSGPTLSADGTTASFTIKLNGSQTQKLVAFSYQCYNNTYNLGVISTKTQNYFYYIIAIDLFICLCFLIFLVSEAKAEKEEAEFFKKTQVSLNDFAVQIKKIDKNTLEKELNSLLTYFKAKLTNQFTKSLISITIPDAEEQIEQTEQRRELFDNLYELMNKFYFKNSEELMQFKDCHQIIMATTDPLDYDEFKEKLKYYATKILNLKRRNAAKESTQKVSVYLVFNNVIMQAKVLALQKKECCSNKLVLTNDKNQEKSYILEEPPVPDSINWKNQTKWTKLRLIISLILTLCICVGSYLLFGQIQYQQSLLASNYNYNIDCSILYQASDLQPYSETLNSKSTNYITCYCSGKSLLSVISSQANYCQTWQKQYLLNKAIPLLISLGIVIFNIIVTEIFKILSRFEKHKYTENEELSFAFKRAFLLVMNMGLMMILLNINYNNSSTLQQISFIFLGKYDDFTSDWYNNIGSIIILTMIFNIAFPIIELLLTSVIKCIRKCWDTRCCQKVTSRPTKKEYIGLYSDQIFPVGERYAYLMATFFITMTFSGVIPLLYPVAGISFFLLYFSDKLLLFKFYQTPLNYTKSLHKGLMVVVFLSLLSHFALSAYFLSQSSMIMSNAFIGQSYSLNSGNTRINNMIKTGYIIPYIVLFVLLIIYAIFKEFIARIFTACLNLCMRSQMNIKSQIVQKLKLLNILSNKQIDTLTRITEVNLAKVQFKKREQKKSEIQGLFSTQLLNNSQKIYDDLLVVEGQVFNETLEQLRQMKKKQTESRQKLLGLPSYEESVQADLLQRDEQLVVFEKGLRGVVQSHILLSMNKKIVNAIGNFNNGSFGQLIKDNQV